MKLLDIDRTLSVLITYKCNAECLNCGTFSNPRIRGRLSIEKINSAIYQAARIGFANVVFTGGEATLYFKEILQCIQYAAKLGLPTRLVTNGIWGLKSETAIKKAALLKASGLTEINFSTGNEHVRFVPPDAIVNCIVACLSQQIECYLMIEKTKADFTEKDLIINNPKIKKYRRFTEKNIVESPWMPLDPNVIEQYPDGDTANRYNINKFKGCDSVLQTYVISTDETMHTCCGIGSRHIEELQSLERFEPNDPDSLAKIIFEAEQDLLKLWIRNEGPERILKWASEKEEDIQWENMYAHRCQACLRLYIDPNVRRTIAAKYKEKIPDVLAKELVVEHLSRMI